MDRLGAMQAFVGVVDTGSFSTAARRLGVGQPAVSKAVARLEGHLGATLLLRSNRGLTATEAGHRFYEHAVHAIEEAEEAYLAARGAAAALSGRLQVHAAVTFARLHVIPHLPVFLARHTALDVEVVMDDRALDLIEEGIDLSLRLGPVGEAVSAARKLGECRRLVLALPSYFARWGEPAEPRDLAGHQAVVLHQAGMGAVWPFRRAGVETSVAVGGRVGVNTGEGVRAAVFAGLGLAASSEWLFSPELANGIVRQTLADWEMPRVELWAVFPSSRFASAKANAFASFIETSITTIDARME